MEGKKKKAGGLVLLFVFLGLTLAGLGSAIALFLMNEFTLTLTLEGPKEITLDYGDTFQEPGYRVMKHGTIFLQQGKDPELPVTVMGTVDPEKLGEYELTYTVQDGDLQDSARRTVTIVDREPPVLTVDMDAPIPIYVPGEPFLDDSYEASDNYDGDLTDQVMVLEKQGQILYSVRDSSGNETTVTREVPEYDPVPPQIHLEGGTDYHIRTGHFYEEPGYQATDRTEGDLTDQVEVEGEVNWYTPGTYPVTYRVSDPAGNQTEVTRIVTVDAAARPEQILPEGKTIYLTFDDGPGPYTNYLLDVLKKYDVKATFFVVGNEYPEILRRIAEEGHSLAAHSITHNYYQIYASPQAYFDDILGEQKLIKDCTGVETYLMRFPGGSSNLVSSFNKGIMTTLTEAVRDAGFQYFDWNVDSMDAGGATTADQVYHNVIAGVQNHRVSVVLQHDIHPYSVSAVESIIEWGQQNGYQFLPLEMTSFGAHHGVNN